MQGGGAGAGRAGDDVRRVAGDSLEASLTGMGDEEGPARENMEGNIPKVKFVFDPQLLPEVGPSLVDQVLGKELTKAEETKADGFRRRRILRAWRDFALRAHAEKLRPPEDT